MDDLDGKIIAIYGVGVNAQVLLETLGQYNVLCFIDEKRCGKYFCDKKILSLEEAVTYGVDIVFIAAELASEMIVKDRIYDYCVSHNVSLRNMYGLDYLDIWRSNIDLDIQYASFNLQALETSMREASAICIEMMGGIFESSFYSNADMWEEIEQETGIEGFAKYRKQAEDEYDHRQFYSIEGIYESYKVNTFCPIKELKKFIEKEESTFEESLIAKNRVVEFLNQAYCSGKKIFVFSSLPYSEKMMKRALDRVLTGVQYVLVQENAWSRPLSKGMFRMALGDALNSSTLYLGNSESIGFYLARCYDLKRVLLKDSLSIMLASSDCDFDISQMSLKKRTTFKAWCAKEYNSPFLNDWEEVQIDDWIEYTKGESEKLDIIPLIESDRIEDYPRLDFEESDNPEVSIIIPVYNHFSDTYRCLEAILRNTLYVDYEVIIADDASTDMTGSIEEMIHGIRVIKNETNVLFLKNCNNAAKFARGKYLLFLNNDTQVRLNWLLPLVYLMENNQEIGLTGSKLIGADGLVQEAGGVIFNNGTGMNYGRGRAIREAELNYVREVDYISGASIMVRKTLWQEIGGFDERFAPAYCEDSDLAFEVRKRGYKVVYQPSSEAIHFEGVSNGTDLTTGVKKFQEVNTRKLYEKWKKELEFHYSNSAENYLNASERKHGKKTILFISAQIPTYDKDAGSKTVFEYINLFIKKGYIVKFWPINEYPTQPYTHELQQLGVQVLYRQKQEKTGNWVLRHAKDIDYAFVHYPNAANEVIDLLNMAQIKVRYYGHDLHYLRLRRGYEKTGDQSSLQQSNKLYIVEKNVIKKAEIVYYPSNNEVEVVKKEFGKDKTQRILPYFYQKQDTSIYDPDERSGMMFIGGTHAPNEDAVQWFLNEVYPQICKKTHIQFLLVGATKLEIVENGENCDVVCTGYVTDQELQDLYHKIKMVVIPLRYGAGIKGKLVDAMYYGVPVITTTIGAEGVDEQARAVCIADDAVSFAESVCNIYQDRERLLQMSSEGRKIIEETFSEKTAWNLIERDFN